ncbi:hypothetical protein MMC30_004319 [Trapelia coarctata]|nr:hypothetical protein [Trapelia coarctata]
MSANPDSTINQGEFRSHVPPSEPLTTRGHKPGTKVGNDAAPTFTAKTLPPGSAPADRTFAPNPTSETPSQANNPDVLPSEDKESTYTPASATLIGATSEDVHTGLGKPMQGQTHGDEKGRLGKRDTGREGGLAGVGASGMGLGGTGVSGVGDAKRVDERVNPDQRGLEREEAALAGQRGDKIERGAEEKVNVTADELAAEVK